MLERRIRQTTRRVRSRTLIGLATVLVASLAPGTAAARIMGGISLGVGNERTLNADSPTQLANAMTAMYGAGVRWLRVDTPDPSLDGGDNYSSIITAANVAHIKVIALIEDWGYASIPTSACAGSTTSYPTSCQMTYITKDVMNDYWPAGVTTYEVLNEPNESGTWIDPADYVPLLKAAYNVIHNAHPLVSTVITGSLGPAANQLNSLEPYTYMQDAYADGAHGNFDAVGLHPYTYGDLPNTNDPVYNPWQYIPMGAWSTAGCAGVGSSDCIYSITSANGDGSKKIWLTEFGAPTGPDAGYPAYSQQFQADSITQAFADANAVSYSGPLLNYEWWDSSVGGDFGLLTAGGANKLAYQAFKDGVNGTASVATLTNNQWLYGSSSQSIVNPDSGAELVMQSDGNLVVYSSGGIPLWSSGTYGNPGATLYLQNVPGQQLVIKKTSGSIIWNSGA